MYRVIHPIEIEFYTGPGALAFDAGDTFDTRLYERSGNEWSVLVTSDGEEFEDYRQKDIDVALMYGDIEEV